MSRINIRLPLLLPVLILAAYTGVAQEICDNGIDDDGDGLIDLKDPDCQCHFIVTNNLLQNASFESYSHCPVVYTYDSNYNVATYWQFGTRILEVDHYHNLNCSYDSGQVMLHMPPKIPIPDGTGFIGILNSAYIDPIPENQMDKSYVGQCLQAPLKAGEQYTLSFYAGRFRSWDNLTGKIFPFTVAVFGNADCNAVPFGKSNVIGNGCPADYPGWTLLGKTVVESYGDWVQSHVTFTVPTDINVIQIGPDCSVLPPIIDLTDSTTFLDYHLYYLDDLHLLPTKDFPFEYIQLEAGTGCNGSGVPVLEAPVFANATYQWYKDSIAIPGATASTYTLPALTTASNYNVVISAPGKCVTTEPFLVVPGALENLRIPTDTVLCTNGNVTLARPIDGVAYSLNGTPVTDVTINRPGSYLITATDNFGCQRSFQVNVVGQNCADCELSMPNAFTPNGDGLNDIFKAKLFCSYSQFSFQIFNRWGQKVFESRDGNDGWDGTYLKNRLAPDIYVYFITYKTASQVTRKLKGTVMLIR